MLEVSNLTCVRGERQLFARVGFLLERGQLLHVTGANGAGKTSLLRMLCGLSPPEAGHIHWNGQPIKALGDGFRQELFYLGHANALQEALTVSDNLLFAAALHGHANDAAEMTRALAALGLRGCQQRQVRQLSQGQKRRVALARLMLSRASLWVLDEPFVALDQAAITLLADLVVAHLAQGGLAVLTSHQAVDFPRVTPHVLELGA
jgi:heme exporter protein A